MTGLERQGMRVFLNEADVEAAQRIIESDPTILNVTDAVRRALHEKDRAEVTG